MGYNSARYVHTVYQAMNLAFADRDFYYGDPYFPPEEPVKGLLSKEYAQKRRALINPERNDPDVRPGDPYPFQGGTQPVSRSPRELEDDGRAQAQGHARHRRRAGAVPPGRRPSRRRTRRAGSCR